jgi:hypothetical protein
VWLLRLKDGSMGRRAGIVRELRGSLNYVERKHANGSTEEDMVDGVCLAGVADVERVAGTGARRAT